MNQGKLDVVNAKINTLKLNQLGISLVVQWLRLCSPSAESPGSNLVRELDPNAKTKDPTCGK